MRSHFVVACALVAGCAGRSHTSPTVLLTPTASCDGRRVLEITNAGQRPFNVYWIPPDLPTDPSMTVAPSGALVLGRVEAGGRFQTARFTIPGPGYPFVAATLAGPTAFGLRYLCYAGMRS
jgi:hypothetical protein